VQLSPVSNTTRSPAPKRLGIDAVGLPVDRLHACADEIEQSLGLCGFCAAVMAAVEPNQAKSIEQKSNQTVFKKGVYRMKSLKRGQRACKISKILEIELFAKAQPCCCSLGIRRASPSLFE